MTPGTSRRSSESPNRRLVKRLAILAVVGILAAYFQTGYEEDGIAWMFFAEMAVYTAGLFAFLCEQTGRLKSGPDSNRVSGAELFEEDHSMRFYVASYLLLLMLFVCFKVFRGDRIDPGPWDVFISVCPIFAIVFFGQFRLERKRVSARKGD